MNNPHNSHEIVRTAIHVFILIAIGISLFQQLSFVSNKGQTNIQGQSTTAQVPQPTGPVIPGIAFKCTQKFNKPIKQFLVKNELNIEVGNYQFKGNEYWFNLILNWGHMALVYILMTKYRNEVNQSSKRKLMIGGAIAVVAWFFVSSAIKPQRISVQISGANIYQKDYLNQSQINDILIQHQFNDDDVFGEAQAVSQVSPEQQNREAKPQHIPRVQANKEEILEQQIF